MSIILNKGINKISKNTTVRVCHDILCPTPKIELNRLETYAEINNKIYCLFCYTKNLAASSNQVNDEPPSIIKTKSVPQEKLSRIESKNSFFSKIEGRTTTRIPSTDNINVEIDIWKEIFPSLSISKIKDTGVVNSINKLINNSGRIIQTSTGHYFVQVANSLTKNRKFVYEISSILHGKHFEIHEESLENLSMRAKNWVAENYALDINNINNKVFILYEFMHKVSSNDDFDFSNKLEEFLKKVAFNFGSYIYRSWFIGNSDPINMLIINNIDSGNLEFISIQNTVDYSPFDQEYLDVVFQGIVLKIPFILDQIYLEEFIEGCISEKNSISNYLKQKKFYDIVSNFYSSINADKSFLDNLPDLPSYFSINEKSI